MSDATFTKTYTQNLEDSHDSIEHELEGLKKACSEIVSRFESMIDCADTLAHDDGYDDEMLKSYRDLSKSYSHSLNIINSKLEGLI